MTVLHVGSAGAGHVALSRRARSPLSFMWASSINSPEALAKKVHRRASCSLSAGGRCALSRPAMTMPKGDALAASSMMGLGGTPTTTCQHPNKKSYPCQFHGTFVRWAAYDRPD